MKYKKEQLLKLATKNLIVNKEVAKLAKTKTMTRRLKTNLKVGDVFWLREPAKVESYDVQMDRNNIEMAYEFSDSSKHKLHNIPERFIEVGDPSTLPKWIKERQGVPNGCIKEMARHFYQVVSVHSERLQDISQSDVEAEGTPCYDNELTEKECKKVWTWRWINLWNSTAKAPNRWEDNPMVEVIEYKELSYE